ncbi:hypothetical protein [Nocardia sp. NPDC019304]|uniref:hypothetical protein n=1 Tax=unclassified Nocardia TaxID=2637762 RepID=UPI00340DBEDF
MSPSAGHTLKSPPVQDGDDQAEGSDPHGRAEELALAAEAAEAEALAAEARAEAARARVRAAESRRRARTSAGTGTAEKVAVTGFPPQKVTLTRRLRGRTTPAVGAMAVIAVALASSGYMVEHHRDVTQNDRRAAEFTAAARQGVVALTTLDFNRANEDVQRVLDNSTGSFRGDFQTRAADFTTVIQQSRVATEGKVNATALESMTENSAVVLVAATSQVTNSAGARQEPRAWRLSVTVTRDGDQLKMSKVEFVP